MHESYQDIRSRIAEPPKWWDECAVPRYEPFSPDQVADIYAHEVALVEIACQGCEHAGVETLFLVAFSWNGWDGELPLTLERVKQLHYGDPPNTGCCMAGATMNSIPRRVVEFWRRGGDEFTGPSPHDPNLRVCLPGYFDWRRVPELEIPLDCDWVSTSEGTNER